MFRFTSSRKDCFTSGEMVTSRVLARYSPFRAFSMHWGSGHIYVPRPAFLPVVSRTTSPSGVRTIRNISFLGRIVRQPMQVLWGIFLAFIVFGFIPLLLFSSGCLDAGRLILRLSASCFFLGFFLAIRCFSCAFFL